MRFLCVKQPTQADIFGQAYDLKPLDPAKENIEDILVTDQTSANELLARHPDILIEIKLEFKTGFRFPRPINRPEEVRPNEKILILRNGGIGDHIMLLPALQAFRERVPPDCRIWLATQKEKQPLFESNPHVERLLPLPLRLSELLQADGLIDFSGRRDWYDLASLPMTDAYLNFFHLDYTRITNKRPRLYYRSGKNRAVLEKLASARQDRPGRPLVLLNWKASNRLRDLPAQQLLFLTAECDDILFAIGQPAGLQSETAREIQDHAGPIVDCSPLLTGLDPYLELLNQCDAVVSTDTAAVHLAEALDKPHLALYGPTRDELWIKYYARTIALRAEYVGRTCRSPCGLTKNTAAGCPEAVLLGSPYSPCLLSLNKERIKTGFRALRESLLKKDFGNGIENRAFFK